jgi:hypothetical protein
VLEDIAINEAEKRTGTKAFSLPFYSDRMGEGMGRDRGRVNFNLPKILSRFYTTQSFQFTSTKRRKHEIVHNILYINQLSSALHEIVLLHSSFFGLVNVYTMENCKNSRVD